MEYKRPSTVYKDLDERRKKAQRIEKLQVVPLPALKIFDPRFNRSENLILNILKYSCPKSAEFLNFPARLTEIVKANADATTICYEYSVLLKDTFEQAYSNFLLQGAKDKFTDSLMINSRAKISLESDNKYANAAYPNQLSLLTAIQYNDELESYYENWDDLLYDIYVASEYCKYIMTYCDTVTSDKLFQIEKQTDVNIYQTLIAYFNSLRQTPGIDIQKRLILEKETFLRNFKANQSKFPLVQAEIDASRHIATFACNSTRDKHDEHLDAFIKGAIFEKFATLIVQPAMIDEVTGEYATNSEQLRKVFNTPDRATAELLLDLNQIVKTYTEPLVDKGEALKVVEDVYALFINRKLPENILLDPELNEKIAFFNALKRGDQEPRALGRFLALDKQRLRKAGDTIALKLYSATPSKFNFLAPGDKSISFVKNGITFNSLLEYANFCVMVDILEVPIIEAERKMISYDNVEKSIHQYLIKLQPQVIREKVDQFARLASSKNFFSQNVDSKFEIKADVCTPFFKRQLTEYFTDVKELYVKDSITINDPELRTYIIKKSAELTNAARMINKFRQGTISTQEERLNLWNLLYKLKPSETMSVIDPSIDTESGIQKEAVDYVKEDVVCKLSSIPQKDLGQLLNLSFYELFPELPQTITLDDVNIAVDNVLAVLRTFIFNNRSSSPRTNEELRLVLSIILNVEIPKEINEKNFWASIKSSNNAEFYSKILFMKKLHEVKPKEFFGPRSEEISPSHDVIVAPTSPGYREEAAAVSQVTPISPGFIDIPESSLCLERQMSVDDDLKKKS